MSKTLLIDGNSIGYCSHHATKLSSGGMETQAIFGFIKTMRELRQEYPGHKPMVLWDGKAQWRYDIHPEYKSNRTDDPKKVKVKEAYVAQRPYIARALDALGVRQLTAATHEADDLAGYFVSELTKKGGTDEIVLITGDRDWIQLVRKGVVWRDLRSDDRVVTTKTLMDKTGFISPFTFLEGKCLQGDTSDCIPGVGGIGEKGAPEFLAEFGSVRNFWTQVDSGTFDPVKKAHIRLASEEGRRAFGRNFRLMQLLRVPAPKRSDMDLRLGKFDKEKFAEVCEELAFVSILRTLDHFVQPFKDM